MKHAIAVAVSLTLAMPFLAACASQQATTPVAAVSEPETPAAQANPADRFQSIVDLLQEGQQQQAKAALQNYLKDMPDSKPARYLLAQIETPVDKLYPSESFVVRLSRNQSLGSIAHTYLGNTMAFYGLARYNGIAVPAKVLEGQSIRIPKTSEALAAQKSLAVLELRESEEDHTSTVAAPAAKIAISAPTPPSLADRKKAARRAYRDGLIAFQKQDLETAIGDWNKTIALDPDNNEAKINLAQAVKLQENLKKLRK